MASVEESIRDRLGTDTALAALVGTRIYPDSVPDYDAPRPWIYYTTTDSAPGLDLAGNADELHTVEFDVIADTKSAVKAVAVALVNRLHKWRGGQVSRALWAGTSAEDLDGGHLLTVRFRVWGISATIQATETSNARIVTGDGRIDLFPTGAGVSVYVTADGVLHGDGSGLTGIAAEAPGTAAALVAAHEGAVNPHPQYARTAASNTFTQPQTLQVPSTAGVAHTFQEVRVSGGNVVMRGTVLSGAGATNHVLWTLYRPVDGSKMAQIGWVDGFNQAYFSQGVYCAAESLMNGGIRVGSYADSLFSGRLSSYAGRGVLIQPEPTKPILFVSGSVPSFRLNLNNSSDTVEVCQVHGGASSQHLVGYAPSSVDEQRTQFALCGQWADSTDATRAARLSLRAYTVNTPQEGLRIEGNSSGVRLGFFGGAGAKKPTVTGSRAGTPALSSLLLALSDLGLLTDSTT